jgi:nucleoside-diphosphate-sugar epimerase
LKAALKNKVGRFYLASSSEAYQQAPAIPTPEEVELKVPDVSNPRYSYGGGKIASELLTVNYLRESGTQHVIFRPHNVYGPQMGYEHVLPELIKKVYEEKKRTKGSSLEVKILGSGDETRSFIYVTDAVRAIEICTVENKERGVYHVGTMEEITIRDLVKRVGEALGIEVTIVPSEGAKGSTPRRCPDTSKIQKLGFRPSVSLKEGIQKTVSWYWNDYSKNQEAL